MSMLEKDIDAITFTVIWNALIAIAEELGTALRLTAFSVGVREGQDFSTAIFDAEARMVAQGNFSPGHLGSMPYVGRHALDYFPPETLRPGDSILVNDSFIGSGHFPDIFQIMPTFLEDRLIGYVVCIAHHVDVGGAAPGSQKVHDVTEAYQEGLRILPVRWVREGEIDADILRLVLGNVRLPDEVRGDLLAQHNANLTAAARLCQLFGDHGAELVEAVYELILDRSEAKVRQALREIPDGTYSFEDYFDDCGPGSEPIRVAIDLSFADGSVEVDFSRSSDQVAAAINSYINYTRAYSLFAIKVFADALGPQNAGAMRPISVVAREGSFFNPTFPAPSGGRAALQLRIFEVVNGAIAQAVPDRAMAAFTHWSNPNIGGVDDATGKPFVLYDLVFGGYGGQARKDGTEALAPVMNCANVPVEVHETHGPFLIRELSLIADSGGAGKFRGGSGIRKDYEILNSTAVVTLLGDRHLFKPYGIFGGKEGQLGETVLNPGGNDEQLGSKELRNLKQGDVLSPRLSGAGGYGEPAERDPKAIAEDIADGYISPEAAVRDYGYTAE